MRKSGGGLGAGSGGEGEEAEAGESGRREDEPAKSSKVREGE